MTWNSTISRTKPLQAKAPIKSEGTRRGPRATKRGRTKEAREYMGRVAALGCVVCRNEGHGLSPAELHHPRFLAGAGQKASDFDVIPLCPAHHRIGGYGVAFHAGAQAFEARYGSEESLHAQTRAEAGQCGGVVA